MQLIPAAVGKVTVVLDALHGAILAFSVGVTYVSKFFPPSRQGSALGIFGAGNVGSAVTKFLAPFVMIDPVYRRGRPTAASSAANARCTS